jgi:hypothetical protein
VKRLGRWSKEIIIQRSAKMIIKNKYENIFYIQCIPLIEVRSFRRCKIIHLVENAFRIPSKSNTFSSSVSRRTILHPNVYIRLKPLPYTEWKCKVESVMRV